MRALPSVLHNFASLRSVWAGTANSRGRTTASVGAVLLAGVSGSAEQRAGGAAGRVLPSARRAEPWLGCSQGRQAARQLQRRGKGSGWAVVQGSLLDLLREGMCSSWS